MNSIAKTPAEYFENLPTDRQEPLNKLRTYILDNLPSGFEEQITYGMVSYVIPHSIYPAGYHCDSKQPLPFISIASQKNFIALYHMGIYAMPSLEKWFTEEYSKHSKTKLDMGKSCIRFKKPDQIPFNLIGELCRKVDVNEWIQVYESVVKTGKK
jgi:hypothetical protein